MAAAKGKPKAQGGARPKKGIGGKLPTKRSINLMLIDENKINPFTAALGIVLIAVLAVVFSKFLVYDRLVEMNQANARVNELQKTLDETRASIQDIGDVEERYAHYNIDGMTDAEMSLIARREVVELISDIIRDQDNLFDMKVYDASLNSLVANLPEAENPYEGLQEFQNGIAALGNEVLSYREQVMAWNGTDNVLRVELSGKTLQNLNRLARKLEESDIVDVCALTTANKDAQSASYRFVPSSVKGTFQIYLVKPAEEVSAE